MTWRTSSGGIASRSTVYFGFCCSNLSTNFCASLSRAAVSACPTNILMTSPFPDDPPQPAVPSSVAAARPPPPNLKKSFRLTVLLVFRMLSSFPTLHLRTSQAPRRSLIAHLCHLQHPLHPQDTGSSHARLLVQLAQHDGEVTGSEWQRTAVDCAPDLGQKRVADVRHASSDHDERRVERADEGGKYLAHEPSRLPYNLERVVVSEGRCLADVPRGERAPLRFGGNGRSSGHGFEASLVAAGADGPVRIHANMPYVPRAPLAAAL